MRTMSATSARSRRDSATRIWSALWIQDRRPRSAAERQLAAEMECLGLAGLAAVEVRGGVGVEVHFGPYPAPETRLWFGLP